MNQAVKEFRESLRRGEVDYHHGWSSVPGNRTLEITHKDMNFPIAIIWYGFLGNATIEILHSFVIDIARRCGLRTFCHAALIKSYPHISTIITGSANKMSKPWLIKNGFKQNKDKDWVLNLEK